MVLITRLFEKNLCFLPLYIFLLSLIQETFTKFTVSIIYIMLGIAKKKQYGSWVPALDNSRRFPVQCPEEPNLYQGLLSWTD
jgi:hypothetical protein